MSTIKALSIKQPWANLIASGEKTIETRRWATPYRGPLLIVSAKVPRIAPAGYALAVADLVDCRRMGVRDEAAARCAFYPDAWAWVLAAVRKIVPFPVRGQLGLFDVDLPATFEPSGAENEGSDDRQLALPIGTAQARRLLPAWEDPEVCLRVLARARPSRG